MTNRTPRYDTDADDKIDNAQVDALSNLAQSDTFSAYPLGNSDLAQLGSGIAELDAGTDANKPSAGTADRFYLATDTNILYYDNGTSWSAIAGAGGSGTRLPGTVYRDTVDANAVDAENIDTTNEALVDVDIDNNQSLTTSWQTIDFDNEVTDVTNSYDLSTNQFDPPEDGYYFVLISVRFLTAADQDALQIRLRNTTDSTNVFSRTLRASGTSTQVVLQNRASELLSAKTYEPQARNANSSDEIVSAGERTYMTIHRLHHT